MSDFGNQCVTSLNNVGDHVWAFLLLLIGVMLVVYGHKDTGELIVGAGLAVFRTPVKPGE